MTEKTTNSEPILQEPAAIPQDQQLQQQQQKQQRTTTIIGLFRSWRCSRVNMVSKQLSVPVSFMARPNIASIKIPISWDMNDLTATVFCGLELNGAA
ncbi:hypothetical protein DID88_007062 [Monilinia fructigena]|uniref:Uncharacterized protein n=1 Tax=Monilinia fructigena TaxID=38457 RepID=A0A395J760_9HELO|nr:hypothetical protein DID88_007062 [Monilinia fructigena]